MEVVNSDSFDLKAKIKAVVSYGSLSGAEHIAHLCHLAEPGPKSTTHNETIYRYPEARSPSFVLPSSQDYLPASAAVAHSRSLEFLKNQLDGPWFDLEAIWEEHTNFEFAARSVEQTMSTMVQEPYVNHVPTMTGGIGRESLSSFYAKHFIFSNPDDTEMQLISRTVGIDRVVDEFIFSFTHDRVIDWL
jgi:carboxymethylenebutenolidase